MSSSGLFRLWLILTLWWIGLIALVSIGDVRADAMSHQFQAALIPPAAFLAIGMMLRSMFTGFRRYPRSPRLF